MDDILIRSDRLAMRSVCRTDAPMVHDLVTRPEVARFLFLFHPGWTLAEAGEALHPSRGRPAAAPACAFRLPGPARPGRA